MATPPPLPPGFQLIEDAAPAAPPLPPGFELIPESPVQSAVQSMTAAGAAFPGQQPKPPPRDVSLAQHWLEGIENTFRGAAQRTNPNVYHGDGADLRQRLGDITAEGDMGLYYRGQDGQDQLVDPKTDVVLRDPATGRLAAFRRDRNWDESGLAGAARIVTQGLAVNPVVGPARGAATTASALAAERAAAAAQDAQAFRTLGVRPFGPAFSEGPVASVAKQLSETPLIGGPVRGALEESLRGAGQAAEQVAGRFGEARSAREAGQVAQTAITRFRDARPADVLDDAARRLSDDDLSRVIAAPARETSLKSKQAALYERAWRLIPEEMQSGKAVADTARVMQAPANTRNVLRDIIARNARMMVQSGENAAGTAVAMPVQGGLLGRMLEAVNNPRWTANLQTLRDMRSELRRLASGMSDTERNTLRLSDLDRLQSGLTQDMIALLARNAQRYREAGNVATARGFERAIREFQRADRFTRLSMERLETIERLFNAASVEGLARNISQAAMSRGRGNLQMLRTLQRTLQPDEMNQVRAAMLRELGSPVGSARGVAQEAGFSVSSFLTRWQNMSSEARSILFGGEHRQAVDDLVRVVSRLANVEALVNTSRSGTNALNLGGLLGAGGAIAGGADAMLTLFGTVGAGLAASVLFSRPAYVRWATRYAQIRAQALMGSARARPALAAHILRLQQMARSDPALLTVVRATGKDGVLERDDGEQGVDRPIR